MGSLLQNQTLEAILTFLGIEFITYKGRRCSNGHKTAKTFREAREFFGKDVMTSGQFIDDIRWWDFKNDWNDLMFLVGKIRDVSEGTPILECEELYKGVLDTLSETDKAFTIYKCMIFIEWYQENNSK